MRVLVTIAVLVVLGTACGANESSSAEQTAADDAAAALCRAVRAAAAGEEDEAEKVFDDDAHGPLHDLADALEDRTAKANLLEAKSRVERGDHSSAAFAALERAVSDAAEAADLERPASCED